jgi:hypothetical protein
MGVCWLLMEYKGGLMMRKRRAFVILRPLCENTQMGQRGYGDYQAILSVVLTVLL